MASLISVKSNAVAFCAELTEDDLNKVMSLEIEYANSTTWKWNLIANLHNKNECSGTITALDISSCGKLFLTADRLGEIAVWNLIDSIRIATIKVNVRSGRIVKLLFIDEKRFLCYGEDRVIRIFSLHINQEIVQLIGHTRPIKHLEISPCKKLICSVDKSGSIKVWSIKQGNQVLAIDTHKSPLINKIKSISFNSKSDSIIVLSSNGSVVSIDFASQEIKEKIHLKFPFEIAIFSGDGLFLACTTSNNRINIVDLESGETMASLAGHTRQISALVFGEDSNLIASASYDKTVLVWDIFQKTLVRNLSSEQRKLVTFLRFSVNDRLLAVASAINITELWWCTRTVEVVKRLPAHIKFIKTTYILFLYGVIPLTYLITQGFAEALTFLIIILPFDFLFRSIIRKSFRKRPSVFENYLDELKSKNLSLENYESDFLVHFPVSEKNEGSKFSGLQIKDIERNYKLYEKQKKREAFEKKKQAFGELVGFVSSSLISGLTGIAFDQASNSNGSFLGYQKVSGYKRSSGTQVEEYWRRKPKG